MIKMKTFFIICDMKENRLDYLQQGASSQEYILDFNLLFFVGVCKNVLTRNNF